MSETKNTESFDKGKKAGDDPVMWAKAPGSKKGAQKPGYVPLRGVGKSWRVMSGIESAGGALKWVQKVLDEETRK